MNEREIIERQIKEYEQAIQNAKNRLKSLDRIKVPDGILQGRKSSWVSISIVNGLQDLYYDAIEKVWFVGEPNRQESAYYLTPCKKEDLEEGDAFFRSDLKLPDFNDKSDYAIWLGSEYVCWCSKGVVVNDMSWKYYWKVEAENE